MNRNRPYDGQPHTFWGERGKTMVGEKLTMRDIADCIAMGFLAASDPDGPDGGLQKRTVEIDPEFIGTEFARKDNWDYSDLYKVTGEDPVAVIKNAICFIEHMLGIYPNVKLKGVL